MGFLEDAQRFEAAIRARDPNARLEWRRLYYRALKYFSPIELRQMSYMDVFEAVSQRERHERERQKQQGPATDSGHYSYPRVKRREIVQAYLKAKQMNGIEDTDAWAFANYGISGRTLRNYVRELKPET